MNAKQQPDSADKGFLAGFTSATAFGEGLDGYDLGSISVVLPFITKDFGLSAVQQGVIAASTPAGIFFGALVGMPLIDKVGRRPLLLTSFCIMVITLGPWVSGAAGSDSPARPARSAPPREPSCSGLGSTASGSGRAY